MKKIIFLSFITCICFSSFAGTYSFSIEKTLTTTKTSDSYYRIAYCDLRVGQNSWAICTKLNMSNYGDMYAKAKINFLGIYPSNQQTSYYIISPDNIDDYQDDYVYAPDEDRQAVGEIWVQYWNYASGSVYAGCAVNEYL